MQFLRKLRIKFLGQSVSSGKPVTSAHSCELQLPVRLTRQSLHELLVPKCHHRINSRGAAGGDVAREQSDNGQKQPNRGKGNRIGLTYTKELRLEQARECQTERGAHDEARQCEPESLAKNEAVDAPLLRAERHTDADFARSLPSSVSHNAIDADGGEQHGKKTERAGKRSRDALKK